MAEQKKLCPPAHLGSEISRLRREIGRLSPGRKALIVTLISLSVWLTWSAVRRVGHPWADLSNGVYTDHFSHMNTARVFPRVGRDLWRKPIAEQFRTLTDEEMKLVRSSAEAVKKSIAELKL